MNPHLKELIALLRSHEVDFLVVGSTCLAVYARPRFTEDIDLWLRRSSENVERLAAALAEFGISVEPSDLQPFVAHPRQMITLGAAPSAIDMLNFVDGLDFDQAWTNRVTHLLDGVAVEILSLEDFVRSKRTAGRAKDLADLALLEEVRGSSISEIEK